MLKLNPIYKEKEVQSALKKAFQKNKELPHIILEEIFTKDSFKELKQEIKKLSFKEEKVIAKYQYKKTMLSKEILPLQELNLLIQKITGKKLQSDLVLLKLHQGDYTLLHDSVKEQEGIDLNIEITVFKNSGGNIIYKKDTNYYTIPMKENSISLVKRKKGVQKFIKYINHHAKKSIRYIALGDLENRP